MIPIRVVGNAKRKVVNRQELFPAVYIGNGIIKVYNREKYTTNQVCIWFLETAVLIEEN